MNLNPRVYFNNRRRDNSPLTDDEMRIMAPSIFAETPHESRSDRYSCIPTISVLDELRKEGFEPFMATQTKARDDDKIGHAKHLVRLRHRSQAASGEWGEIVLLNSHDGSSSYQMHAGWFRQVCANGMVCGKLVDEVRVPHKGRVADAVVEGAHMVLDGFNLIREHKEGMVSHSMTRYEQEAFAKTALAIKYDGEVSPIEPAQLLRPRRADDLRPDLWHTFQVVQENMIKGGLRGRTEKGAATRTRAVKSIDTDIRLNRELWILAELQKNLRG